MSRAAGRGCSTSRAARSTTRGPRRRAWRSRRRWRRTARWSIATRRRSSRDKTPRAARTTSGIRHLMADDAEPLDELRRGLGRTWATARLGAKLGRKAAGRLLFKPKPAAGADPDDAKTDRET